VNGIYNLGWGREITDLEIFETVRDAVGSQTDPVFAEVRPGEVEHVALDASLATKELGWTGKVDLQSGIAAVVEYYRTVSERMDI
jgi:UDP-glucose 4-epimerase